jgi:hypothetical protein
MTDPAGCAHVLQRRATVLAVACGVEVRSLSAAGAAHRIEHELAAPGERAASSREREPLRRVAAASMESCSALGLSVVVLGTVRAWRSRPAAVKARLESLTSWPWLAWLRLSRSAAGARLALRVRGAAARAGDPHCVASVLSLTTWAPNFLSRAPGMGYGQLLPVTSQLPAPTRVTASAPRAIARRACGARAAPRTPPR